MTSTLAHSNNGSPSNELSMTLVYDDPVYGAQRFPAIVRDIIATEQFQRLRHIKQLGACNFVFAGAEHTRYEHCLGVCHLVIRYLAILKRNSSSHIRTDEFYELCVILAGLLHDIGHGPYSHMWEPFVRCCSEDKHWAHENTSCDVVEHLFATNGIRLSADAAQHEAGVRLIAALIRGDDDGVLGDELHYLAEIVNNKYCLIDVDKWDYMVRDVHHLGGQFAIDRTFQECFQQACVVRSPSGRTRIAFHECTIDAVRAIFANRALMHRTCYQQVTVVGAEIVLRRIFQLAEMGGFRFEGKKLSECHRDMRVYQLLDDTVLGAIERSDAVRLQPARDLVRLLRDRLFTTDFDEQSQTVKVYLHNNNNKSDDQRGDATELSYRLNLPDTHMSLPDILMLRGDDGWTAEVNPKEWTKRS